MGEGTERNQSCWCGSGRKLKHCHRLPRQPRRQALTLDFGRPVAPSRIQFDPLGRVQFLDQRNQPILPEAASVLSEYSRAKGPKLLYSVPLDPGGPLGATLGSSLLGFDRLYLIDTNSLETSSGILAVSAVFACHLHRLDASTSLLEPDFLGLFEFRNVRNVNPERLGWSTLVQVVRAADDYDLRWRIGLFADSDLDRHQAINSGSETLYDDFRLPVTFRLLYASDQGSDSVFNKLMRNAHQLAGNLLAGLRDGRVPHAHFRRVQASHLCDALRVWTRVRDGTDRLRSEAVRAGASLDSLLRVVEPGRIVRRLASRR
jgi:hypothetical protein